MEGQVYDVLCRGQAVELATFSWGLSQHVGFNKETLNAPLSTIFDGAITGACYAVGAGIVIGVMPKQYWGLVTIASCAAIAYKQVTMLYNETSSPE